MFTAMFTPDLTRMFTPPEFVPIRADWCRYVSGDPRSVVLSMVVGSDLS